VLCILSSTFLLYLSPVSFSCIFLLYLLFYLSPVSPLLSFSCIFLLYLSPVSFSSISSSIFLLYLSPVSFSCIFLLYLYPVSFSCIFLLCLLYLSPVSFSCIFILYLSPVSFSCIRRAVGLFSCLLANTLKRIWTASRPRISSPSCCSQRRPASQHRVLKWRSTLGMNRRRFSAILAVAVMKSANSSLNWI